MATLVHLPTLCINRRIWLITANLTIKSHIYNYIIIIIIIIIITI